MERCILLTARRYDFKDAETGRRVEGVTLTYLTGDPEAQADYRGQAVMSIPAPSELWHQLQAIPGVYAIDFRQRPGPKGRPTLQATGAEFLSEVDFGVFDGFGSADRSLSTRELRP
jgi:hypothetical protein